VHSRVEISPIVPPDKLRIFVASAGSMSHEGCRLEPIGKLRIGLDGAERIARAGGDDRNLKFVAVLEADTAEGSNPTGNRSPYATIDRTPCR